METLAPFKSTLGAYKFVLMVGYSNEVINEKPEGFFGVELSLRGEKCQEL